MKRYIGLLGPLCLFGTADAADPVTTPDLITTAPYQAAYQAMVRLPDWVITGHATAVPVRTILIAGRPYRVGHMCKPHDCGDQQMDVLFDQAGTHAWSLLSVRDRPDAPFRQTLLGSPSDTIEHALRASFRNANPD